MPAIRPAELARNALMLRIAVNIRNIYIYYNKHKDFPSALKLQDFYSWLLSRELLHPPHTNNSIGIFCSQKHLMAGISYQSDITSLEY
ncbi:hypothetical protein GDO86_004722 [Hymenochirus boettgeri]|uniref:Uncharacterized protein n=1 Tax=Hymenochirus boettgeri TaxID=247094 RepID=A0A8T2KCA3_9PIPI|nr:hypothetical protein GDO86_004722 [Hymenochirus boettgeri]